MKNELVECHILSRNLVAPRKVQYFLAIQESKHAIGAFILQALAAVGIDVVHYETDIRLGISIQTCAFWQKIAYKFAGAFRRPFW